MQMGISVMCLVKWGKRIVKFSSVQDALPLAPLKPNTEYPQYKRYVNGTEEAHVPTSEELEDIFRQ